MAITCPSFACNHPSGLTETVGSSTTMNLNDLDSAKIVYVINKNSAKNRAPGIGDRHPDHSSMYCVDTALVYEAGFAKITVSYKGFLKNFTAKMPMGGATRSTTETNIALHPNYIKRPNTWIDDKYIFGSGPSPNSFGRITESSTGTFLYFGPLPDGKNGRPAPAAGCPGGTAKDRGVCHLKGVEAFLEEGATVYSYAVRTKKDWASSKIKRNLGKICEPQSRLVPVPKLVKKANWLFTNATIEALPLSSSQKVFMTTLEFTGSGPGGWNSYLYEKGDSFGLDGMIGNTPV